MERIRKDRLHTHCVCYQEHYGYLWWIVQPERNIYAAIGDSGNVIYVDPGRNMVAAVSSYFKPTVFDRVQWIENVLLQTLQENGFIS